MKPMSRLVAGLSLCLFAWFAVLAGQEPQPQQLGYVPDEVLVRFRPEVASARRDAIVRGAGAQVLRRFDELNLHRVRIAPGSSVPSAIAALRLQGDVVSAEPNFIRQIVASANDPYWSDGSLWGLRQIQADAAWNLSTGSATVVVADFDTGVNYNHPDLAANMWRNPGEIAGNGVDDDRNGYIDDVFGIDTANNDQDPMDDHGHGTHTAGTIGAVGNNATGVVGVNWNVKILACKFMRADGGGSDADAIECFNYIVALKKKGVNIRVSSNSWGSSRAVGGSVPQALKSAIDAAANVGILNVFAAGNVGTDNDVSPFDPASIDSPGIISVAASDSSDQRAGFSNYGVTSVDLAAPGVGIFSTRGDSYSSSSGTSMAAPHVAGAVALLSAFNSTLTATGIKTLLMDNVDRLPQWSGVVASGGRLNVFLPMVAGNGDILPTVSITSPAAATTTTAPASITVAASASDADGTVTKVDFYANGALIGTDTTSPYSVSWANVVAGSYQLTAVATDNRSFTTTSDAVGVTVSTTPTSTTRINVALASNGGAATASSSYTGAYGPNKTINGDRTGSGGMWSDNGGTFPDWVRVDFAGAKTIDEIDLFMVQDNYTAPSIPTSSMTFSKFGLTSFQLEYWTGTTWTVIPGGMVTGNRLVWHQLTFAPITTTAIRVFITGSIDGWSRLVEFEAYSGGATAPPPPPPPTSTRINVALAANGGTATASSSYTGAYGPNKTINGDRTGSGGMWSDNGGTFPDWVRVDFAGAKTIDEIDLFMLQDNYTAPSTPTSSMTFSKFGLTSFQLEYWTGTTWTVIPGGMVTGNRLVWHQLTFAPITTTAIRVFITGSIDGWSRLVEFEAYSGAATAPPPPPSSTRTNVALASNGGTATASTSYTAAYGPTKTIDGDRTGSAGMWSDSGGTFPDWVRVDFAGAKTIDEIDLFMVQDNYTAPGTPTLSMTFNKFGLTSFQLEYWTGTTWTVIPGGMVTGNRLVWRQLTFAPITTTAIRVFITGSIDGWSRLTEIEAYGTGTTTPPTALIRFPSDNWWYLDIANAPLDTNSANYIAFIGSTRTLHPDFGGPYGMPHIIVDGTTPKKAVQFGYSSESDGVDHTTNLSFPFYPIPDSAITQPNMIEGVQPGNVDLRYSNDRHLLIVDKDNRHLYELWNVFYDGTQWQAGSGAFFDMNTNNRRTEGWTSADAAGLAILPGLLQYSEVFGTDEIRHAFRVTVRATNGYVYPGSHRTGTTVGALPMGARLRLKASKDLSGFSPEIQRVFRALKRYGLIVADNGSDMFISGGQDARWDNDVLNPAFAALMASDFEVVTLGYR